MEGFKDAMDPNKNGFVDAMDPRKNGFIDAMDPNRNGFGLNFSREGINQKDTIIKGIFSTNKMDQQQGYQAMIRGGGPDQAKIYDHPIGKPNNYDPVYNPDSRLPDAPKKPTTGTSTYSYIGGAAVLLLVFLTQKKIKIKKTKNNNLKYNNVLSTSERTTSRRSSYEKSRTRTNTN